VIEAAKPGSEYVVEGDATVDAGGAVGVTVNPDVVLLHIFYIL
jgi:hypothetical protein